MLRRNFGLLCEMDVNSLAFISTIEMGRILASDILPAGLLIVYTRLFDLSRRLPMLWGYFLPALCGYGVGLMLTDAALAFHVGGDQVYITDFFRQCYLCSIKEIFIRVIGLDAPFADGSLHQRCHGNTIGCCFYVASL